MTNSLHSNPARQRGRLESSAAKRFDPGPRRRADRLGHTTVQSLVMIALVCWGTVAAAEDEPSGETKNALVIRLIHPERQAQRVLKLFEGSRAATPPRLWQPGRPRLCARATHSASRSRP